MFTGLLKNCQEDEDKRESWIIAKMKDTCILCWEGFIGNQEDRFRQSGKIDFSGAFKKLLAFTAIKKEGITDGKRN